MKGQHAASVPGQKSITGFFAAKPRQQGQAAPAQPGQGQPQGQRQAPPAPRLQSLLGSRDLLEVLCRSLGPAEKRALRVTCKAGKQAIDARELPRATSARLPLTPGCDVGKAARFHARLPMLTKLEVQYGPGLDQGTGVRLCTQYADAAVSAQVLPQRLVAFSIVVPYVHGARVQRPRQHFHPAALDALIRAVPRMESMQMHSEGRWVADILTVVRLNDCHSLHSLSWGFGRGSAGAPLSAAGGLMSCSVLMRRLRALHCTWRLQQQDLSSLEGLGSVGCIAISTAGQQLQPVRVASVHTLSGPPQPGHDLAGPWDPSKLSLDMHAADLAAFPNVQHLHGAQLTVDADDEYERTRGLLQRFAGCSQSWALRVLRDQEALQHRRDPEPGSWQQLRCLVVDFNDVEWVSDEDGHIEQQLIEGLSSLLVAAPKLTTLVLRLKLGKMEDVRHVVAALEDAVRDAASLQSLWVVAERDDGVMSDDGMGDEAQPPVRADIPDTYLRAGKDMLESLARMVKPCKWRHEQVAADDADNREWRDACCPSLQRVMLHRWDVQPADTRNVQRVNEMLQAEGLPVRVGLYTMPT